MDTPDILRIDSNVVWQLGEQLITDAEQALLELVKNSYDADARDVKINIDTNYQPPTEFQLTRCGRVEITDTGSGMTLADIQDGWYVISLSRKRSQKKAGQKTLRGRTPQGDKGLGRLSTMKIGDMIELETHYSPVKNGQLVRWKWADFIPGTTLDKITIYREEIPPTGKTGTKVTIIGLKEAAVFSNESRRKQLQSKLSTLISPFSGINDFKIALQIDGRELAFEKLSSALRETAVSTFRFKWAEKKLSCSGRVQLVLFRGKTDSSNSENLTFFEDYVRANQGKLLFDYLSGRRDLTHFNLSMSDSKVWYIDFHQEIDWDDMDKELFSYEDPGPFEGEIDSFDFEEGVDLKTLALSNKDDYKNLLKNQSGVFVYRDGFGVRTSQDWLRIASAFYSSRSYYSLRPSNTLGYIAISASDNGALEEKSDREGFTENGASRQFYLIVNRFLRFANDALHYLRRGYSKFRENSNQAAAELPDEFTSANAKEKLKELKDRAEEQKRRATARNRPQRLGTVEQKLETLKQRAPEDAEIHRDLKGVFDELQQLKIEAEQDQQLINGLEQTAQQACATADAIQERFNHIEQQLADVYGNVGVGIAAQTLAHDTDFLIDELIARTKKIGSLLKLIPAETAATMSGYMEAVKSIANNIRRHLRFINPMLYGVRETKQRINIAEIISEYLSLRSDTLKRYKIELYTSIDSNFFVNMNKGRFLQVIDNLIRNSEYWLRQHAITNHDSKLEIRICVNAPRITVSDTGPGIRPAIEETLFDAFVTDKNEGHGLGLFIARQLLERERCFITLDSARNEFGKRFRFTIDLAGVVDER